QRSGPGKWSGPAGLGPLVWAGKPARASDPGQRVIWPASEPGGGEDGTGTTTLPETLDLCPTYQASARQTRQRCSGRYWTARVTVHRQTRRYCARSAAFPQPQPPPEPTPGARASTGDPS